MRTADLNALQQMLEESAPEKRTQLLSFVSDTCRRNGTLMAEQPMQVLANFAISLVERVDIDVLREASVVFSHLKHAPHELIHKLANQQIDVAAPVLQNSIVLKDDDLIDIIQKHGHDHHFFIAQRPLISSPVTDHLIISANPVTALTVVKNPGAAFSKLGFERLAASGIQNEILAEALIVRPDMPEEIATPLLDSFGITKAGKLIDKGKKANIKFGPEAINAHKIRCQRALFLPLAKTYIDQIGSGEKTLDNGVMELCEQKLEHVLCQVLASFAQAAENEVSAAFSNISGTRFVQLCKKLKLSHDAFHAAAILRTQQAHLPNSQIFYLMKQYDSISSLDDWL